MHTPRLAIQVSSIMNAPEEAFDKTVAYVRICGGGMLVIVAYNLIGCIFRGIGDSRTPLFTVAVACVFNIAGDLILCAGFKMGTSGAAFATVFAQVISVIVSFGVIRKKELPFEMHKTDIGVHGRTLRKMVGRFLLPLVLECFSCHFSMEMCWREFFPPMQWSSRQRQIT